MMLITLVVLFSGLLTGHAGLAEDNRFVLADGEIEAWIDRGTGWLVRLRSLKPEPMDLLDEPSEGWGAIVASPADGWEERFDLVNSSEFGERGTRFVLTHRRGIFDLLLTYLLREGCLEIRAKFKARKEHRGRLLLALCQPSAPREPLLSYPYSEGVAATGGNRRLKVGPAWHGRAECKRKFAIGPGFEVGFEMRPLRYGLGPCGAELSLDVEPRRIYRFWFTKEGELKVVRWCGKSASLLSSVKFEAEPGKRYKVKIAVGEGKISCAVNGFKVLEVRERVGTSLGNLSLSCGWLTGAEFDDVEVRDASGDVFKDGFEKAPIGSGGGENWRSFGGVCVTDGGEEWGGYPARFVDLPDRYLVWGETDLFKPIVFTKRETKAPWVGLLPRDVKCGDTFSFELVYKLFDSSRFGRRNRLRWYVGRIRASDPFFRGEPVRLTHRIARHLPEGNLCFYLHGVGRLLKHPEMLPLARKMEERMKKLKFTNIVYLDWYSISDGEPPKELLGAWLSPATGRMLFGEGVKRDIKRLQDEGFKVILYVWPVTLAFNPREPDKFSRYLEFLKRSIDFYEPDGIGYDMNWQVHKECLKLQFELYRFIKAKGKPMWAVIDYGFGTPSQLYADALLSEFGPVQYGFPENPVTEATWALRTGLFNLLDFAHFAKKLEAEGKLTKWGIMKVDVRSREELERLYVESVMKGLALGATWADYARIFVAPEEVPKWDEIGFKGYMVPFPKVLELKDLAEFSAKATGTPILTDSGSVKCHPDLATSAWADGNRLLIAAYRFRTSEGIDPVWIEVSREVLRRHGFTSSSPSFTSKLIGPDGLPVEGRAKFELKATTEAFLVEGSVPDRHLLLICALNTQDFSNSRLGGIR